MADEGNAHTDGVKRAIVLVPGMVREERNFRRQVLIDNLIAVVQRRRLVPVGPVEIVGETGQRIEVQAPRDNGEEDRWPNVIDVFEAYWTDLVPDPSTLSPWRKLWNGFDLLVYWLLDWRAWRAFTISPTMSIGLFFGALLLVLWYASIVLIAAQALSKTGLPPELDKIPEVKAVFDGLILLAGSIGDWKLWMLTAALLSVINVDELVGIARATKQYMENSVPEAGDDTRQVGLRDRMRERIVATLERVLAKDYDEVVVVAHSFGTVIAADALREWPGESELSRLRLITLGSPLAVLRCRSDWMKRELDGLLAPPRLSRWTDYYSDTDWICAAVPGHDKAYAAHAHHLKFEAPLLQRLTGRTHLLYYREQRVLTELAGPW